MNENEPNGQNDDRADALNKKKAGYERNRMICAIVIAFIGYSMWQAYDEGTTALWFWLTMSAIVLACIAVCIYDTLTIRKLQIELAAIATEEEPCFNLAARILPKSACKDDESDESDNT